MPNGLDPYEADGMDESDGSEEAQFEEATRRPYSRVPQVPSRNFYRPRPDSGASSQINAQLAAMAAQLRTMNSRLTSTANAVSRETSDRRKDTTRLKSNLSQTQQMSAILPLLTQQSSITLAADVTKDGNVVLPQGTVLKEATNTTNLLLPLLLMTSMGDSSSGGGGGLLGGGGDNNNMLMLALLLTLGNR